MIKGVIRRVRTVAAAAAIVVASSLASAAHAQTVGASLQGIVTDPAGAGMPNAYVVVISVATGTTWELKTDSTGHYRLPVLQPGEYELHVSRTGFRPVAQRGIRLTVGQDAVIDVKLELGRISEEMTVTGAAPIINTTSGALSGLVSDKEIRALPLNGRSFQQLALLPTGVTPAFAAGNDVVGGRTPKISINGARPEQLSPRRHRHQQRLQQDAGIVGGRPARRRSGARVPGTDQCLLGGVRPLGRRRNQRGD